MQKKNHHQLIIIPEVYIGIRVQGKKKKKTRMYIRGCRNYRSSRVATPCALASLVRQGPQLWVQGKWGCRAGVAVLHGENLINTTRWRNALIKSKLGSLVYASSCTDSSVYIPIWDDNIVHLYIYIYCFYQRLYYASIIGRAFALTRIQFIISNVGYV